jgi:hypothetical protein
MRSAKERGLYEARFEALPLGGVAAVFDEDGRLLGRGKVQAGRLKNLLPKRFL